MAYILQFHGNLREQLMANLVSNSWTAGEIYNSRLIKELKEDLEQSIIIPSFTTIGIMIIFPFLEIFIYCFIGKNLSIKESLYTILLTLIPFVLGYKVANKIFENGEVVILLILSFFIVFSGITLKNDKIFFEFGLFWYFLFIGICILWTLIDFSEFNRIRQNRKEYNESMKKSNGINTNKAFDGMEVEDEI